jgi:hypothetical protein
VAPTSKAAAPPKDIRLFARLKIFLCGLTMSP